MTSPAAQRQAALRSLDRSAAGRPGHRRRHRRRRHRAGRGDARAAGRAGRAARLCLWHEQPFQPAAARRAALPGARPRRPGARSERREEDHSPHRAAPGGARCRSFSRPIAATGTGCCGSLKIGVKIYDLLCGGRNLGKSTWLSQAEVLRAVPGLRRHRPQRRGALLRRLYQRRAADH